MVGKLKIMCQPLFTACVVICTTNNTPFRSRSHEKSVSESIDALNTSLHSIPYVLKREILGAFGNTVLDWENR